MSAPDMDAFDIDIDGIDTRRGARLARLSRTLGLAALAGLALAACDGASSDIAPEDVGDVFIRQSVCRDVALSEALVRIVGSVDGSPAAASPQLACGRDAQDCESFLACDGIDANASCDPSTAMPACDGDLRTSCDSAGFVRTVDCADDGNGNATCLVDELGVARCAVEACEGDGELTCVQGQIEFCGNGVRHRSDDCALEGRTCVTSGDRAACVDRAEPCEVDECVGDVLYACISSGLGSVATDCAARIGGGRCMIRDGAPQCVIEEPQCEPGEMMCAGAVLRTCVGERWIELDCASFQGSTCERDESGEVPVFRCVAG